MVKRPLSISILGYLYAISGPITAFAVYSMSRIEEVQTQLASVYRVDPSIALTLSAVTSLLAGICGIGLLKGKGLARDGLTILLIASGILGFFLSKSMAASMFGASMSALIIYFLHRRPARRFFGHG